METGRYLPLPLFLAWTSIVQAAATAPLSAFDLHLQERIGPQALVEHLVARGSHLYFVCSDSRESVVLQTDSNGTFQNLLRTGIPKLASLDVNDQGYVYALSDDSWLTIVYPNGGIQRTEHLTPRILSLALVDGKPMVADEKDSLYFLGQDVPRFTLAAWPRPWTLFAIGANRLAVWRPEGKTISVFTGEEKFSISSFGREESYSAVAGDTGRIYLLSSMAQEGIAQIHEMNDHARPEWIGRFALPDAFLPKVLGVMEGRIYLANAVGKTIVYPLSSPSGERLLADNIPELITDLTRLRNAVHLAGYQGKVVIELMVTENGVPNEVRIHGPEYLSNHPDVNSEIQALRFHPRILAGAAVAASMTLEIAQE